MLFTQRTREPGIGLLRKGHGLGKTSAGGQGSRQFAAPAIGFGIVFAVAPLRLCQQVFGRQYGNRVFVLPAQRRLNRLLRDEAQRDQVFADPAAQSFLPCQRLVESGFGDDPLCDQQFTEEHDDPQRRTSQGANARNTRWLPAKIVNRTSTDGKSNKIFNKLSRPWP
ncbi:MAG: hypothetical protein JO032_00030 [Alphaproteobacteria bacterium]|nr:hypothetical protein [Alphaproteobacteria bacterium]